MVDPNTRQGKRTPVTLKIKFKSETLEQFIERYAVDVSQGGIFIRTKEPLAVGTQMKFEFQLRDASPLIAGEGTVVWTRENDPGRPAIAPGMGVRFDRLADGSQAILERILAEKLKQAPLRPGVDTTKPPLFTDTPTRVAPAPMQEALLGQDSSSRLRRNNDDHGHGDSHTPLPKPMPFHSDADEFPDEAFEEATKVRALDELIAQTAEGGAVLDELAARRSNGRGDQASSGDSISDRAETLTEPAEVAQQRRERTSGGSPPGSHRDPVDGSPGLRTSGSAPGSLRDPVDGSPGLRTSGGSAPGSPRDPVDGSPGMRNHPGTGRTALLGSRGDGAAAGMSGGMASGMAADSYEAPDLPNPPEPAVRIAPKLLDTSPSPRIESGLSPPPAVQALGTEPVAKTKLGLGLEPAPARARPATPPVPEPAMPPPPLPPQGLRAVAAEQTQPARMPPIKTKSNTAMAIISLLGVAAVAAAVWFFVLRPRATELANNQMMGSAAGPGSTVAPAGSSGSGEASGAAVASGATAPSAATDSAAKAELVDTVITSNAQGAKVEVKGTDQSGPAPFTAKLEAKKPYTVRVTAPGHAALELDIKGGDDKPFAKLVAKPRMIAIETEPAGALVSVDGVATGRTTPTEIELSAAQAAKKSVKIAMRKSGFRTLERTVEIAKLVEDEIKLSASLDEKLTPQPTSRPTPAQGSAKPPSETSEGGSTPPAEGPVTSPGGESAPGASPGEAPAAPPATPAPPPAAPPAAPPTAGSASEPEPEFTKSP